MQTTIFEYIKKESERRGAEHNCCEISWHENKLCGESQMKKCDICGKKTNEFINVGTYKIENYCKECLQTALKTRKVFKCKECGYTDIAETDDEKYKGFCDACAVLKDYEDTKKESEAELAIFAKKTGFDGDLLDFFESCYMQEINKKDLKNLENLEQIYEDSISVYKELNPGQRK